MLSFSQRARLNGHHSEVRSVQVTRTELLLTAGSDGLAQVWSSEDFRLLNTLNGVGVELWKARISDDGNLLATLCTDGLLRIWTPNASRPLRQIPYDGEELAFIADSHRVIFGGNSGLWLLDCSDLNDAEQVFATQSPQGRAALSPSGRMVVEVTVDHRVVIWDWNDRHLLGQSPRFAGEVCAEFSAGSDALLVTEPDRDPVLWSIDPFEPICEMKGYRSRFPHAPRSAVSLYGGRFIGFYSPANPLAIWNIETGHAVPTESRLGFTFEMTTFSEGTMLLSGNGRGTDTEDVATIWRVEIET